MGSSWSTPVCAVVATVFLLLAGCGDSSEVTIYVALDQQHSEALIKQFEVNSGVKVKMRFDTEASKTVGLVSAIIEEAARPRCDVFWNNELAQTVRLDQKGLLQPYVSSSAEDLPATYKGADGSWTGFAARARVLIVNTERVPNAADRPTSMWDLIDPKWKGQCAVARPLTGTTLTHFTALRGVLGEAEFERFLAGLFRNEVQLLQSNGATMRAVRAGELAFAFTDTDDFSVALDKGFPVTCVFPDQSAEGIGTMLIPNSVAMIRGAPHPEFAKRLIDFIVSAEVEQLLAAGRSAQIPLRWGLPGPRVPGIPAVSEFKQMQWNVTATAALLEESSRLFAERFGG